MKIFFSVGEPSGDLHGANLIRQLQKRHPGIECVGYGGPRMAAAGCHLHEDLTQLAVMWFLRVFLNLHKFLALVSRAEKYFCYHRPDAVVLIDYPGFNWWIAGRAKRYGIPVIYYGAPQIWGWARWRLKKMRKLIDHALVKLPFEEDFFRQNDCRATYVGHPYFDELNAQRLDADFIARENLKPGRLITILPGSRSQEINHNLAAFIKAAAEIHRRVPDTRFAVAAFKEKHAVAAHKLLAGKNLPIEVHVGRTPELIHLCHSALACSGSVSLELLYHRKPTVIQYRISPLAFEVQKHFRKVKFITLVNLLETGDLFPDDPCSYDPDAPDAEDVPFPEYLTAGDRSRDIAAWIVRWLTDKADYEARVERLSRLCARVAHGGASERGAEFIVNYLAQHPRSVPRPHFLPTADWQPRKSFDELGA